MAEVTIYGEANFQGASASVASGEFGESLLVLHMNDAVSSIKVPTGMVAVVLTSTPRPPVEGSAGSWTSSRTSPI